MASNILAVIYITDLGDAKRNKEIDFHNPSITAALHLEEAIYEALLWQQDRLHKEGFSLHKIYGTLSSKDMMVLKSRKIAEQSDVISALQSTYGDKRFKLLTTRISKQAKLLAEQTSTLPTSSYVYETLQEQILNDLIVTARQLQKLHRYYLSPLMGEMELYDKNMVAVISAISLFSILFAAIIFINMARIVRKAIEDRDAASIISKDNYDMAQAILDSAEALIVVMDDKGRIEQFNHMCERASLYSYEEVKGKYAWDVLFDEHQRDNIISIFHEMIEERSKNRYKLWITTKSRERRLIEWSSGVITQVEKPLKLAAIGIDITEKQQVEDRLNRSEKNLLKAQEISCIGNWVWDITSNTLEWSDEIYRIFGVENKHLAVTYDDFINSVHPQDREKVEVAVLNSVADAECPYNIAHRIVRPDGEILHVSELGEVIRDTEGNAIQMIGTIQDRTEQVLANEKLYHQAIIIDQTHDSIITTNTEGFITGWNNASTKLFGYKTSDAIDRHISFLFPEDRHDYLLHEIIEPLHEKGSCEQEIELLTKSGEQINAHLSFGLLHDIRSKAIGMVCHSLDITDRVKAEAKLKVEKDRAQTYLDIVGTILIALDDKGIVQLINRRGCEIIECNESDVIGKNWFDGYIPERMIDDVKNAHHMLMSGDTEPVETYENPIVSTSGDEKVVLWNNSVIYDEEGKAIGTLSAGEDITERKKNEEELRHQAMILEQVHDAVIVIDMYGVITSWNKGAEAMYGYSTEEALGIHISAIHENIDETGYNLGSIIDMVKNNGAYDLEAVSRRKDGQLFNAQTSLSLQLDQNGKAIGIIGYIRDITQRIESEAQLTKSLAEKEVLLRELHHRVKNILQIISSLINMQSRQIEDNKAREAFVETRDRIRAVALIYEKLFGESNLSEIDVKKYIEYIAGRLDPVYEASLRGIKTEISGDSIILNMERALPCGLIANELLTNVYKHAFTDGRPGHAKVVLSSDNESGYSITVSDDGIGIENKEYSEKSFGMDIMSTLTRQIHGNFEISGKQGTTANLTFSK
ncbi:MAG: PAS domain S-box protein [Gammaproteobacteria bacterium]|nr:PAS domain S-box protein [Gammaproteobacteria bacterium]